MISPTHICVMSSEKKADEEKIFSQNINLVHKVLQDMNFKRSCQIYEDIFQEGCIGLLIAIRNYDDTIGKFSSYAYSMIKGHILNYLNHSQVIKPDSKIKPMVYKFNSIRKSMTVDEIKMLLSCNDEDLLQLEMCCNILSLNQKNDEDDYETRDQYFEEGHIEEGYEKSETIDSIIRVLKRITSELPRRKPSNTKANLEYIYKEYVYDCIVNGKSKTIAEYAEKYNVSKQRMQVLIRNFKNKFKEYYYR